MSLQKCVALITGGAQGFGRAFTERLLKEGAKVAILDINDSKGKAFEAEMGKTYGANHIKYLHCDVTNQTELFGRFEEAKANFGSLNLVCNNAGILTSKPEDTKKAIDINLTAVIQGTFKAIDLMSKKNNGDGGLVVNIASAAGIAIMRGEPIYTATKQGVVAFTRSFEFLPTLEEDGVRVNCLCPFVSDTDMARNAFKNNYNDKYAKFYQKMGFAEIDDTVNSFMRCVNEKKMNANCIAIYPKNMVFDVHFPDARPSSKL
ncbi:15-hydroxyprostaglandin dehydrogenase [NAD(+)]-like [Clytia hemisphaerica]|uniref:15-hydroxyprostaglandin dehydrogenase [NAD(+)] n=1 Tax=Clytia hemisphaerica TaxID=252671 RepID=A0A7M5URI1_9CNID